MKRRILAAALTTLAATAAPLLAPPAARAAVAPCTQGTDTYTITLTLDHGGLARAGNAAAGTLARGTVTATLAVTKNGLPDGSEVVAFSDSDSSAPGPVVTTSPTDTLAGAYKATISAGDVAGTTATIGVTFSGVSTIVACPTPTATLTQFGPVAQAVLAIQPDHVPVSTVPSPQQATAKATLTDAFGNGVNDETVHFTISAKDGFGASAAADTFGTRPAPGSPDATIGPAAPFDGTYSTPIQVNSTPSIQTVVAAPTKGSPAEIALSAMGDLTQYGPPNSISLEVVPNSRPADGVAQASVRATVKDASGIGSKGAAVAFSANDSANPDHVSLSAPSATTNDDGVATVIATASSTPGTVTMTASATCSACSNTAPFVLVAPAATFISVTLAPESIPADGISTTTGTATVYDQAGVPMSGVVVTFTRDSSATYAVPVQTNSAGRATLVIRSTTTPGVEGIMVTTSNGVTNGAALTEYKPKEAGYWLVGADGAVYPFGDAADHGSTRGVPLPAPIVAMAATPAHDGYWLVGRDGSVFAFGKAHSFGGASAVHLNAPMVGIASTPDGGGYWLLAQDGGVFSFGNAAFHGSTGSLRLNAPVIGIGSTPTGNGYFLVATDGGIFAFGDAVFQGSMGGTRLNKPVVGMALRPTGPTGPQQYWLVASDGGIFSFPDGVVPFYGSTGSITLNQPIVGMSVAETGDGYRFVARDGGVFAFGPGAPFVGSATGVSQAAPIVGMDGF